MLEVFLPLALIARTIHMDVDTLAIGLVIHPVAFIHISVYVSELAKTMSSVVFPVSFIACAIGPDLLSIAIAESTYPLARVFGARRISIGCSLLTLSIWIIWLVGDSFLELNSRKVS